MPTSALILLTVTCFFVRADSDENIYSDNGWRPMSNEKVFALQRNFIKTPIQVRNSAGNSVDNVFQRNAIKIVKPSVVHLNKESIKGQEAISLQKEIERNGRAFEDSTESSTKNTTQKIYYDESKLVRKAKNIAESDVILVTDNVLSNPIQQNADEKNKTKKRKISSLRNSTYDVHENLEQDNLITDENNFKSSVSNGYRYERPKLVTKQKNNLTSSLFNILANYNIRTDDKLPNYALSLRQNSRNLDSNDFVYMHVPIKIPFKYNSPNHLPIDPLLAVFLSNYGHYMPRQYGFQRRYENLYGYLASNNIHNNNPYGSYKIFSDTDSSH
ncbi:uncharacterized protein LOC124535229 [Vanessa cardui]|uniref:uncharacterized protein LOC124535229 n=1 Tax=Vanessa cardui TaxID=171605 RepID=UPI001F1373E4|nr:uncharacterized protein LOC124535229 [Vanessa cardui]